MLCFAESSTQRIYDVSDVYIRAPLCKHGKCRSTYQARKIIPARIWSCGNNVYYRQTVRQYKRILWLEAS